MSFSFKPPVIGVLLASHVWLPKGNNKQNTRIFPLRANVIWLAALAHLRYTIGMIIPLEWHHNPVLGMEKNLWHMFKPPVRGIPTRWVKHGNMARLAAGNIWNHQPSLMFIIILHIYIYVCVILYFIALYYIKYYYKIILLWDASHAVIICSKSLVFKKGPFRWLEPGDASGLGVKLPI